MGEDFEYRPLRLRLSIDCSFVEPQHGYNNKKFLLRFKYDKSKAKEYQLALMASLKNMWVTDLIGHMGANMLITLL
jgi:hypothetical protein